MCITNRNNIFYIIHSTDSMALSTQPLGAIIHKTVTLADAMQPACMRQTNTPFNLAFAIGLPQCLDSSIYIAIIGPTFNIDNVQKKSLYKLFCNILRRVIHDQKCISY